MRVTCGGTARPVGAACVCRFPLQGDALVHGARCHSVVARRSWEPCIVAISVYGVGDLENGGN